MANVGKNKPRFYAPCTYGCDFSGFSHVDQDDAERARRNHESRCELNPDNDPDAIR